MEECDPVWALVCTCKSAFVIVALARKCYAKYVAKLPGCRSYVKLLVIEPEFVD